MKIFFGEKMSCDLNYAYNFLFLKLMKLGEIVTDASDADVIVFPSTCCGSAESLFFSINHILETIENKKSNAITIVTGCIAGECRVAKFTEKINGILKNNIDYIIPEDKLNLVINIVANKEIEKEDFGAVFINENRAKLYISQGCMNQCSFCKTTYQKLNYKSVDFDSIEDTINGLPDEVKTVDLFGTNISQYGKDLQSSYRLSDILELLEKKERIENVNLWGFAFKDAIEQNFQYPLKHMKKVNKIGGSVESGSDRILSLMNKGYTSDELFNFWLEATSLYPKLLHTDIIAGFPTETIEDIKATLNLLKNIKAKKIKVHRYDDSEFVASHKLEQLTREEINQHYHIYTRALNLKK